MTNNNIKWISIQRFWPIFVVAIAGAIAFTTLQMKVDAMYDKGVSLREDYEETKLRQDMLILKQVELIQEFEKKLIRLEMVVEFMENGNSD